MRAIDGDKLLRDIEKYHVSDGKFQHWVQIQPTIEPQRKKGKWINVRHDNIAECDQCGITGRAWMNFCFDCGADMCTPVETARDIVHKAIDNSVWSDTVGTAEMHKVVDDKYAEMTEDEA